MNILSSDYRITIRCVLRFPRTQVTLSNWHPVDPFEGPWVCRSDGKSHYFNDPTLNTAVKALVDAVFKEGSEIEDWNPVKHITNN